MQPQKELWSHGEYPSKNRRPLLPFLSPRPSTFPSRMPPSRSLMVNVITIKRAHNPFSLFDFYFENPASSPRGPKFFAYHNPVLFNTFVDEPVLLVYRHARR